MILYIIKIADLFLVSAGLLFIFLELRTKYDKSFFYFGISLIILALMSSFDIWSIFQNKELDEVLYWTKIHHLLGCGFSIFTTWYMLEIIKRKQYSILKIMAFISIILSLMLLSDFMFYSEGGEVKTTLLYSLTFLPYFGFYCIHIFYLNIKGILTAEKENRKILILHLVGILSIILFGMLDVITAILFPMGSLPVPSFLILGTFSFGIIATLIFTERFMALVEERKESYEKLENAYKEMEEVSNLRKIGESTSIINHEIRNYMMIISGMAEMVRLSEPLTLSARNRLGTVVEKAHEISAFSEEILNLSKGHIVSSKDPVNLSRCIVDCVDKNFSRDRGCFMLDELGNEYIINGDWGKLQQAFFNVFKNSIEAKTDEPLKICVRAIDKESTLLLIIEDNGTGSSPAQSERIFESFFTTKGNKLGTGLGMSLCRTIIESHGGKISAYGLNDEMNGAHGFKLIMIFPKYTEDMKRVDKKRRDLILVKDGIENITKIINVFRNIACSPIVVQYPVNINISDALENNACILGTAKNIDILEKSVNNECLYIIKSYRGVPYIITKQPYGPPEPFSEEFLCSNLMPD